MNAILNTSHPLSGLKDPALLTDKAYVGGRWIAAPDGRSIAVTDPYDGTCLARVPDLGRDSVREAIAEAVAAQRAWRAVPARERARILRAWFDLVLLHADDLALILVSEQGKPLAEARGEILSNAAYLEWFAEEAKRLDGEILPGPNASQRVLVLRQPIGVCAAITPWNFPNGMITRKAGPALAAGCALILKPASQTPLSALALAVLAERAGVPRGVFSVVTGAARPIGEEFTQNPDIAKISFTGSTSVGRWLMREASGSIKRLSLELGGNAPFIVFPDADLEAAVEGAMISKFRNSGQTCVCANRIFVHEDVAERFTDMLATRVASLRLGRGTDREVTQGPLIDGKAVDKIEEHIADAVANGARIVSGGRRSALGGSFFEPTILSGVRTGMKVMAEETFAPLAPLIPFSTEDEVVALANDTEFGLAAYVYTRDLARVWRVAEALESGMVGINTGMIANEMAPFGGVKQSGLGREGSRHGIDEYVELKYVALGGLA